MTLNKSTSVFVILLALACKGNDGNKTVIMFGAHFCEIEVLKGRVKELSQDFELHDSDRETETFNFDQQGNQSQMRLSDVGGSGINIKYLYKYDAKGKKAEAFIDSGMIYRYDKNNHITEAVFYQNKNILIGKYEFKYNSAGYLSECAMDTFNIIKYKYDSKHLLIESDVFQGNKYLDKPSFTGKSTYDYKSFDSVGNWVKVVAHYENRIDTITRKITYY